MNLTSLLPFCPFQLVLWYVRIKDSYDKSLINYDERGSSREAAGVFYNYLFYLIVGVFVFWYRALSKVGLKFFLLLLGYRVYRICFGPFSFVHGLATLHVPSRATTLKFMLDFIGKMIS